MQHNGVSTRAILYLSASLTVMAGAAIAPALPAMAAHFGDGPEISTRLSLMVTLPALCTALVAPLGGWVGDRAGRAVALVAALLLYAIAGAAGLFLTGIDLILASRALVGISVALVMTSAIGLVGDLFSGEARSTVVGRQAAWTAIGGIVFPLVGGIFADITWRGAFVPFLLAAPLALWARATLPRQSETSGESIRVPLNPVTLSPVMAPYLIAILGMALFNVFPIKIGFHLQGVPGLLSEEIGAGLATGLALGWLSACAALSSTFFAVVYTRLGRGGTTGAFFLLLGLGYVGIGAAGGTVMLVTAITVAGVGLGLLMPVVSHWVLERAPEATRGALLGGLTTAVFAGQFSAQFVADPLSSALGSAGLFLTLGGVAAGAGITMVMMPRLRKD